MSTEKLARKVFLSHTKRDEPLATAVLTALRDSGLSVWDDQAIEAGADWRKEIEKGLSASDSMIAILNTHSFSSVWVRNELDHALFSERFKGRFLPVLIDEEDEADFSRLPWVLTKIGYLRVSGKKPLTENAGKITEAFLQLLRSQSSK